MPAIRSKPIFFWAFSMAFISCAFISCFLALAQLVMYDFPKWADYGTTFTALVFTYISVKQGINFYRIKKWGLYYFLVVHCISIIVITVLMIKDGERLYMILIIGLCGVAALQYKLISIVKKLANGQSR